MLIRPRVTVPHSLISLVPLMTPAAALRAPRGGGLHHDPGHLGKVATTFRGTQLQGLLLVESTH